MENYWQDPLFKKIALTVLAILLLFWILLFPFRKKNPNLAAAFASIQSWIIGAPFFFLLLGLGENYPIYGITFLSILGAKEFFQITGMFHRSWFVWVTYAFIGLLGYSATIENRDLYNVLPMIFLGTIFMIPIIRNSAKYMIQYVCLSLLNFLMLGWGFMHTAWIAKMENGVFFLIYLIMLTEISDNISLSVTRMFAKIRVVDRITTRRTLEGILVSICLTLIAAYSLRRLIPDESSQYWLSFAVTALLVGSLGDLVLAVIRRDLGAKDVGAFIIGRGGILDRLDRLICTSPIYYFVIKYLGNH
ncbi:MAG: phosphatidate cytidylyltransferase [Bdellovibrionales bacterium]|nr:phosphatidate cytidylyltransferase [Bdellovibrionales bacterium]